MRRLFPRNALRVLVFGFWIAACGSPTAPVEGPQPGFGSYASVGFLDTEPDGGVEGQDLGEAIDLDGRYVLDLEKGEGGQVETRAGTMFVVFPGILDQGTRITLMEDVESAAVGLEFGPEGLHFLSPACLMIRADAFNDPGLPGESFDLRYFDPDLMTWVVVNQTTVDGDGRLCYPIGHFSKYAISRSSDTD